MVLVKGSDFKNHKFREMSLSLDLYIKTLYGLNLNVCSKNTYTETKPNAQHQECGPLWVVRISALIHRTQDTDLTFHSVRTELEGDIFEAEGRPSSQLPNLLATRFWTSQSPEL
jgi:hypothetical protein